MAEEDRLDRFVEDARAFVDARPVPDVRPAVMRRIQDVDAAPMHETHGWGSRVKRMLWERRHVAFEIRPAYAVIAAAVLFVVLMAPLRPARNEVTVATAEPAAPKVLVQFRLQSSEIGRASCRERV